MMETFFFISLGITFVLILLLVYHFKQRLAATEQKADTMFEIMNNLAQEMSGIKTTVVSLMTRHSTPYPVSAPTMPLDQRFNQLSSSSIAAEFEHSLNEEDEEDEEDEDEEDEEDEDEDKIIVSDNEDDDELSVQEIQVEVIQNCAIDGDAAKCDVITEQSAVEVVMDSSSTDYNKMSLSALKALVVEKGILEDASKLKKAKLLELMAQHNE